MTENSVLIVSDIEFVDAFGNTHAGKVSLKAERESGKQYRCVSGSISTTSFGTFDLASPEDTKLFTVDS